ncbi:hypothetical protein F442_14649 [Phytophthora nicotianae P10297]|uniref:Uncharacterized protein n=1 Tax=Phytophthora nicotianae P10297 TaxID=1317064 RepID=W2YSB0_PHYNI|nr:hypothetical protein F442_14649 [Phytophthora nicotianae P10297]
MDAGDNATWPTPLGASGHRLMLPALQMHPMAHRPDLFGLRTELEDIEFGIKKLFRMVILGPSFSGKNNLVFHILKHSPHVFAHLHIIARNPHQELYDNLRDKLEGFIIFHEHPPQVDAIRRTPVKSIEIFKRLLSMLEHI